MTTRHTNVTRENYTWKNLIAVYILNYTSKRFTAKNQDRENHVLFIYCRKGKIILFYTAAYFVIHPKKSKPG